MFTFLPIVSLIYLYVVGVVGKFADDSSKKPRKIVDAGCGIGGSSRYLARKYEAECRGITLSPVQAQRAQALAAAQGLDGKVRKAFQFSCHLI